MKARCYPVNLSLYSMLPKSKQFNTDTYRSIRVKNRRG